MRISDRRGMWVKVDGFTRPADVGPALAAGVSAIGVIFAPSSRRVTVAEAKDVLSEVPAGVQRFGVFDDSAPREVGEIAADLGLDGVQFPAPLVAGRFLEGDPIILRTVRVRDAGELVELDRLECDAVHLDAYVDGQLGGTGTQAPWELIAAARLTVPFVISGGLRPDNVAEAVRTLAPAGVDVSSGVETEPGVKDANLIRAFVEAARS